MSVTRFNKKYQIEEPVTLVVTICIFPTMPYMIHVPGSNNPYEGLLFEQNPLNIPISQQYPLNVSIFPTII